LMRFNGSDDELSVSVNVEVPLVIKMRRGSADLRSKGMAKVVRTWVPETFVSQEAFQASRMLMWPD